MPTRRLRADGRPVIVTRPEGSAGTAALTLVDAFARARDERAAVCVLPPLDAAVAPLCELTPLEIPRLASDGVTGARLRAGWHLADGWARLTVGRQAAVAAVRYEWQRELRRRAGDERLPLDVRARLRESAHGTGDVPRGGARRAVPARHRLLTPVAVALPPAVQARADAFAARIGLAPDRPIVAVEGLRHPAACLALVDWLVAHGYTVVRLGGPPAPVVHPAMCELTEAADQLPVALAVLLRARYVVCESLEWQQIACLTNTPSLLLNARDAFAAYPVRARSRYTLATPVDLDSGRTLAPLQMLDEWYARNRRNLGFRDLRAADVVASLREMDAAVAGEDTGEPAQARFREVLVEAGRAMAPRIAALAACGAGDGVIGDGCLAAWQARHLESVRHAS